MFISKIIELRLAWIFLSFFIINGCCTPLSIMYWLSNASVTTAVKRQGHIKYIAAFFFYENLWIWDTSNYRVSYLVWTVEGNFCLRAYHWKLTWIREYLLFLTSIDHAWKSGITKKQKLLLICLSERKFSA